ncbi:hypothetical protein [Planctomicrobium piriforme]|uniref:Uncharacterized protein n=1 Tax=Planctomicrobium piriforme TaxID=1576369 RepID=A0A1I3L3I1_9PLAN|nr:hypothetical protein [Planctomicrobium piriforme]SFI78975.1 hypothetical protein SAMN05421753_112120 [Planctomicrobium piriforme]
MAKRAAKRQSEEKPECFVIMPISTPPGYEAGHFATVYRDLFEPACEMAGFKPHLASNNFETNLIHLDIVRRLVNAPMVLCDLSSRNPNVLFELGIRQAFDKPSVLVQEEGTERIFDINPFRIITYRASLKYSDVVKKQSEIAEAINKTVAGASDGHGVNTIVKLLNIPAAVVPEGEKMSNEQLAQLVINTVGEVVNKSKANTFRDMTSGQPDTTRASGDYTVNSLLTVVQQSLGPLFILATSEMNPETAKLVRREIASKRRAIRGLMDHSQLSNRQRDTVKKLMADLDGIWQHMKGESVEIS